jgi:endonuclease YncB( thermonuclease family)
MSRRVIFIMASLAIIAGTAWLAGGQAPSPPALVGQAIRVVDGDSLYLDGHQPQIRLWGVDAPERDMQGFNAATRQLKLITSGQPLTCNPVDRDRYGRTVARCFRGDGQEINRMMIESGTATEFMRYSEGFYSR